MPNVAQVLRDEITRLARKEIRAACDPLRKQVRALRQTVKSQQETITRVDKALAKVATLSSDTSASLYAPEEEKTRARVTPASIKRHRTRLKLSQAELGTLLDVSTNTIVRWEAGTSKPRVQHRAALLKMRGLGRREVTKMLEECKRPANPPVQPAEPVVE